MVVGQFIESDPMFLMYLSFGSVIFCTFLFVAASYFATKAKKEEREKKESMLIDAKSNTDEEEQLRLKDD